LRLIGFGKKRLRLHHVQTGARLDLVDSHSHETRRDMGRDFAHETEWHTEEDHRPVWTQDELTVEEKAYEQHVLPTTTTVLRSSLLVRVIPLFWDHRLTWTPAPHPRAYEVLTLSGQETVQAAAEFLTASEARIPGAAYKPWSDDEGVLALGNTRMLLRRR
jgi:hypothetical protein